MKDILIIEDDKALRENLTLMLSMHDFSAIVAEDGKTGLHLIRKRKPDLILCDVMLPDIDGYQILEEVAEEEEFSSIPFLFLTAKAEITDFRKAMNLGADDYLTKPFKKEELLRAIELRLEKSRQRSEAAGGTQDTNNELHYDDTILVNQGEQVASIKINSIECILAENVYSQIITAGGDKYLIRKTMKEWDTILPAKYFIRIHRSTIINIDKLTRMEKGKNSSLRVYMQFFPKPLEVGRRYVSSIKSKIFS